MTLTGHVYALMLSAGEKWTLTGLVNDKCYNGHVVTLLQPACTDLSAGAAVSIHSLKSSPECNGLTGEVQSFDAQKARWNVTTVASSGEAAPRVLSLRSSNVTLISNQKPSEKWLVFLDAPCWCNKQLTVKRLNLRPTDPLNAISDRVKLQMSKLMGNEAGFCRSFLTWKVCVKDRKRMIEKARKVVNRIVNLTKFKTLASLKFNAELKKQARAEAKARDQQQPRAQSTTSFSRASNSSTVSDGPSMRFMGRGHPDYDESRHDTSRLHVHSPSHLLPLHSTYVLVYRLSKISGRAPASDSVLYSASLQPSSRTPHAFDGDDAITKKVQG